jgi:hypothetical protein
MDIKKWCDGAPGLGKPLVTDLGRWLLVDRLGNHPESVSNDSIAILGRVLIAHRGDR